MAAPIILQGSFSLDKKTFYWSGNFIIAFQNKPSLKFTIPKRPKIIKKDNTPKPKAFVHVTVTSGSIFAGFTEVEPEKVWSGELPATIPYASLEPKVSWESVPIPNIRWTGEVIDKTFQGTFALPMYLQNGTSEVVNWWAGNFSFKYTTDFGELLEDYVRPGKSYNFKAIFGQSWKSTSNDIMVNPNLKFTQKADEVIDGSNQGKLLILGEFYSKPLYCYILPFCTEKKEYYWSGSAILGFPDLPMDHTEKEMNTEENSMTLKSSISSQFVGNVVSGSIDGGISGVGSNTWWTGKFPAEIPLLMFWKNNKTQEPTGLIGVHSIEWSGSVTGNVLKGSFIFPQIVLNYPIPSIKWWNGKFSFEIQPIWNSSLEGIIRPGMNYSSKILLAGFKITDYNEVQDPNNIENKINAPIVLDGTLSPDGTTFLWSGKFMLSVKNDKPFSMLPLKLKDMPMDAYTEPSKPVDPNKSRNSSKPVKVKNSVSFTVVTGNVSGVNATTDEAVSLWTGGMPVKIDTNMLNPTNSFGARTSLSWTASAVTPVLSGSFSVTVFFMNSSVLLPVSWTGNFSIHYLTKWGGSFDGLVTPGQLNTCDVVFRNITKGSKLKSPGYIALPITQQLHLGTDTKTSGAICTLLLNGESFTDVSEKYYCKIVPFMCINKPTADWFLFNGDAMLIMKPPVNSTNQLGAVSTNTLPDKHINITVVSGSIVAGLESEYPISVWSGNLPLDIPLPVFWNSDGSPNISTPPEDMTHAHGVFWSGSQMGPHLEGTFSLPQYTNMGVTWWSGQFTFLLQTSWGNFGEPGEIITPGVYYKSYIVFRDIHSPAHQLAPNQIDINSATKLPIILLGSYSPDRNIFSWNGNVTIHVLPSSLQVINKLTQSQLTGTKPGGMGPMKPKQRVGVLVSSGSLNNTSGSNDTTMMWSGGTPVTIPLAKFNISNGVNIIWTAFTLYPKFTGNFSIPQYVNNTEVFVINWIDGMFSFDLTSLWNTSLGIIETGKQYGTKIMTKVKSGKSSKSTDLLSLITDSMYLTGLEVGFLNLKGNFTPDLLYFTWSGEAWFVLDNTMIADSQETQALKSEVGVPTHINQFGGSVYDGSVTTETTSLFSFSHTVWSGVLPAEIKLSSLWTRSFASVTWSSGVTWTATSVSDSFLTGTYSLPQYQWDGMSPSVTWYKGNFKFYVKPLWNATLTSLIMPGTQYYSKINFQGDKVTPVEVNGSLDPAPVGVRAPIILQGTYAPDHTSFSWSGNFILNVQ